MRRNLIIFLALLVLISVLFFLFVFRPQSSAITEATAAADAEEQRVEQLELELARLQELEKQAPQLREEAARFETALPQDPRLAEFILQIQEAANSSGIDWVSILPTPPATGEQPGVSQIDVSMQVTGGYFQMQDFMVRLETLPRAVKVRSVNFGAGPDGLPSLSAGLTMQMFVATPQTATEPAATTTTETTDTG